MARQETERKSGWQFPKALEIVKCKEGSKEFIKERQARHPFGQLVKVCEYSLDGVEQFSEEEARTVWRLAKRAARDFLRVSWMDAAIVAATRTEKPETVVIIYGKAN